MGRFKTDGTYVNLRLIHVEVWHKPAQRCKVSTPNLKKKIFFQQVDIRLTCNMILVAGEQLKDLLFIYITKGSPQYV